MIDKSFKIGKKYVPALTKITAYLTCEDRYKNGDVLLRWSDNGKPVVVTDHSFFSYVEYEEEEIKPSCARNDAEFLLQQFKDKNMVFNQ